MPLATPATTVEHARTFFPQGIDSDCNTKAVKPDRFYALFYRQITKAVINMETNHCKKQHLYSDAELVACYQKYESQIKAAQELGVSRETVARAVRRAGIPLTGRRNNGGNQPCKITDIELITEAKTMARCEIAVKHHMSVSTLDARLSKLRIHCKRSGYVHTGEGGRHYRERAQAYGVPYDPTVTLKKLIKRDHGICQICGRPVDNTSRSGNGLGMLYPTLDHIVPLSKGGGHTWDNVQLAHLICNSYKCDKEGYVCQGC